MMRSRKLIQAEPAPRSEPIPFPGRAALDTHASQDGEHTLATIGNVSRRLEDLARKLNCLGFFDEPDPDRPRAA